QDQQWYLTRGDNAYERENYAEAIEFYKRALQHGDNQAHPIYNLAESYRLTFQYDKAESFYNQLISLYPDKYPLAKYYLGLMLKYNGRYRESTLHLLEFINQHDSDMDYKEVVEAARVAVEGNRLAEEDKRNIRPYQLELIPEPLNSVYNDYGLSPFNDSLVYITSGRVNKRSSVDLRYGESFTDIYALEKKARNWSQIKTFDGLNTNYNDGSGMFNHNKTKYYYTSCDPRCRIYVVQQIDGSWPEPKMLNENVNIPNADNRQPSISYTGDTLYFVSNRKGGFGKNDIWMCVNSGGENWGPAINMGRVINTQADEATPKATVFPNTLLFASKGHAGFGGFDLFMGKGMSSGDTLIYNFGVPFNTSRDDLFPEMDASHFYWSSNRIESLGNFDIFYTDINSEISFLSTLSLKSGRSGSDILLTSRIGNNYMTDLSIAGSDGAVRYEDLSYRDKLLANELFRLKLSGDDFSNFKSSMTEEKYQMLLKVVNTQLSTQIEKEQSIKHYITLSENHESASFSYMGQLIDSVSQRPIPNATVVIHNKLDEKVKETLSNESGEIRLTNIPAEQGNYLMFKNFPVYVSKPLIVQEEVSFKDDFVADEKFDNIYFDYNQYSLRPEAKAALAELADYLKSNPEAQIEILGYTDNTGSDSYNLELSGKRAETALAYLHELGVDYTSLSVVPMGKSSPLASNNTPLGKQKNRRVEFNITAQYNSYVAETKTYFLSKEMGVNELARKADVSLLKILTLNNRNADDILPANTPVRLPISVNEDKINGLVN
ncbi:tetratricopeptide repeat protein, partial [Fulvivirga sp. RKSG066]|uniref:OmpA family protein n=1 Tax=Fulvivirga aurantia TaxID=2529383 RepID=UPI0012BD3C31